MRHKYSTANQIIKNLLFYLYYRHKSVHFSNVEKMPEWNFTLQGSHHHKHGFSAMLRVKNEASKITQCLESIHELFEEIIVINNGSTDNTKELITNFINAYNSKNIKLLDYPHSIARCGTDHENTPEYSIHSLAYYYNWCLAQCTKQWVFKWDADMVIPTERLDFAKSILGKIKSTGIRLWNIQGQTVYIAPNGEAWASKNEINHEERAFPNSTMIFYKKAKLWERLHSPISIQEEFPDGIFFYELKDTRENEFSNWTDTSAMSPRKIQEFNNYTLIKSTNIKPELFEKTTIR